MQRPEYTLVVCRFQDAHVAFILSCRQCDYLAQLLCKLLLERLLKENGKQNVQRLPRKKPAPRSCEYVVTLEMMMSNSTSCRDRVMHSMTVVACLLTDTGWPCSCTTVASPDVAFKPTHFKQAHFKQLSSSLPFSDDCWLSRTVSLLKEQRQSLSAANS